MQLIICIDEETMVRTLFAEFSELCEDGAYDCIEEDHEDFKFLFRRDSDGTEHSVELAQAMTGFQAFVVAVHRGELSQFTDLDTDSVQEPDAWQCSDIDMMLQYVIDGKLFEP